MGTNYAQRSAAERATMMVMAHEGQRLRAMARTLRRAPATISREWCRHAGPTLSLIHISEPTRPY